MKFILALAAAVTSARAYWLMGIENFITTERIDPIVSPGKVASHVHSVIGGSNFRMSTNTASMRQSDCSSIPIPQDKSAYWFPHLYFQWNNGSFTSLNGGAVVYYLFSDKPGTTTAFPDDFRMLSGDPTLRSYNASSFAQQAVTFLCLDFNGVSSKHNELPAKSCPSGIRAQINFPSCWDGKNVDSADHKSHVAFLSGGPDSGTCTDPKFPVTLPRIFMELYWSVSDFDSVRSQAMNSAQPFVFAHGDPTGYGYHAEILTTFINGWDAGILQNAVDKCHCNPYGDAQCCVDQGIFKMDKGKNCRITKAIDEQTTGTLPKLPGNNPVQPAGPKAAVLPAASTPGLISPIYAYTGDQPTQVGKVLIPVQSNPDPVSAGPVTTPSAPTPPSTSSTAVIYTAPPTAPTPSTSASAASSVTISHGTRPHRNPPVYFPPLPASHTIAPAATPTLVDAGSAVIAPHSPPNLGSGTCSEPRRKGKRQNGMHKHRRRSAFGQLPHVRHYDYETN
ncbi:hypothetical protein M413DRAFT_75023 [Hebeloma cylindrosporum]|uniref:DUF1996 domain-containing protein n=1 Tax=Hebeloma cylindrosporum TaxID=76867 RepID=A0A0C2XNJ6_HEBCY|nr:hypothetical protein M413DRAFT_75023 [Hebeloma cylindrosporum h7]